MIRRSKLRERPGAEARSDYARLTRLKGGSSTMRHAFVSFSRRLWSRLRFPNNT